MPGNSHSPHKQMRSRIAHLAARLMAADGVQDFALAKRKAARQLGAEDTQNLPNNSEIEQALRDYHAVYQADEQRARISELRRQALTAMQFFAAYDPHLTGAVLAGTATRHAQVSLMLFTDDAKAVELYLLNQGVAYRGGERRYALGDKRQNVPVLTLLDGPHAGLELTLFTREDLRRAPRHVGSGSPLDKARPAQVEALLAQA